MTDIRSHTVAISLVAALLLAACCGPVRADGAPPGAVPGDAASDAARTLVDEVLRKAGGGEDGLGDWTRGVIGRALDRAGKASSDAAAPLPAERHAAGTAAGLAGRGNSAEVILFTSLSVPAASWTQWASEAARIGAPLVLRGIGEGGLRATVTGIGARIGGHEVGIAIDPRLFRLFGIERVPAVVVAPGGVPPCRSRGCSDDPAPAHDVVAGNIGLAAALEAIAAEGGPGRDIARRQLGRLRGETE